MVYRCEKCNKEFSDKSKYAKHLNRKTSCISEPILEITELVGEDREFHGDCLYIDLIPKSCWFTNVRTSIKPSSWKKLRDYICKRVDNSCEICKINSDELEAHERWEYDDKHNIQKLMRIVAMCKMCHLTTHCGYATIIGKGEEVKQHFMKVNNMTEEDFEICKLEAFDLWNMRNKRKWKLDISLITNNGIELTKKYTAEERDKISEDKTTIEVSHNKTDI